MAVRILDPVTAARRNASIVETRALTKVRPLKARTRPWRNAAGRNVQGRITVRHRGGAQKRLIRLVDRGEEKENTLGVVEAIEYDPNRSAYLARIRYQDGDRRYRLAWEGAQVGQRTLVAATADPVLGNRLPLEKIPVGTAVFNVELTPRKGGKIVRSAGASAMLQETTGGTAQLRLPSGEVRLVPKEAWATVGQASNPDHGTERIGWAGRKRRMGWRPSVRGKAMNPVDHPHGGGEGHNPIGLKYPKTPWGKHALGVKTRKKGKVSDRFILQRRPKT